MAVTFSRTFAEIEIELSELQPPSPGGGFRCRLRSSFRETSQRLADAVIVEPPPLLQQLCRELERRQLSAEETIVLGEILGDLLLPPGVRRLSERCRDGLKPGQGLRIRIVADTPRLAAFPWEYTYVTTADTPATRKGSEGFLALDPGLSLVRLEPLVTPAVRLAPKQHTTTVVALLAEAEDAQLAALDLDREERVLRTALDEADVRLRLLRPGRLEQLEEAFREPCDVLHFAGHGVFDEEMGERPGSVIGEGVVLLSGEDHRPQRLSADQLAQKLVGHGVRLVVLSACEAARREDVHPWSSVATAIVQRGVPAVVGMQLPVQDRSAVAFTRELYQALASGRSIDAAVTAGRLAIHSRGERDWGVPVLYLRGPQCVLLPPPRGRYRLNLGMLAAAAFVLTLWFGLHVEPAIPDWVGWGGLSAGIIAVLSAISGWFSSMVRTSIREWQGSRITQLLQRRWVSRLCLSLLSAVMLLLATTSSVWVQHTGVAEPNAVTIAITSGTGGRFDRLPQLTVSRADPTDGGILWLRPWPGQLTLQITQPLPMDLVRSPVRPAPWARQVIRVPDDFAPRPLRIVRLVTNQTLEQAVPPLGNERDPSWLARLDAETGGTHYPLEDVRMGIVYLGAGEAELKQRAAAENATARSEALSACLLDGGAGPEDMIAQWTSAVQYLATPQLERGSLRVTITTGSPPTPVTVREVPVSDLEPGEITTVCLGKDGP